MPSAELSEKPIWSNPDIPGYRTILEMEDVAFACPYPTCGEECTVKFPGDDITENDELMREEIDRNDGTVRCDRCREPLYGFRGDGDHNA